MNGKVEALKSWKQELAAEYGSLTATSRETYERACRSLPGGLTRHVLYFEPYPLYWERAEGCTLWDADGRPYIDFSCEYTASIYGHSHPKLKAAAVDTLTSGIARGGPSSAEVRLAELLCKRFKCERVRFCNTGTEANLIAIALAKVITDRTEIMVFNGGYHGGVLDFEGHGGRLNVAEAFRICQYNAFSSVEFLRTQGKGIAAVVVEPMLGPGGCILVDKGWLEELVAAAREHGAVVVFDEVMTARLAPGGLQERLDISPDLTTLGKHLGGGFTLSAVLGPSRILDRTDVRSEGSIEHHGTFQNNVMAMSVGFAGLNELLTPDRCVELNDVGDRLRKKLNKSAVSNGAEISFTGLGSLMCLHWRDLSEDSSLRWLRDVFVLFMALQGVFVGTIGLLNVGLCHGSRELGALEEGFAAFARELRLRMANSGG